MKQKVKVKKRIHQGYLEWKKTKSFPAVFGKYAYLYSFEDKLVSLIKLKNEKQVLWETYCLKGSLFEDTIRFKTKKEAEKFIYNLLN
jgi:hypothetical protein